MSTPWSLAAAAAAIACSSMLPGTALSNPMPDPPQEAAPGGPALKNVEFLEQYAATRGFTHGTPKNISITPDGSAVLFLRSGPRSFVQDLFEVDTATGKERVLLTANQLLGGAQEHLTAEELARRERMRLASRGIASYILSKDGQRLLVPLSGRLFVMQRTDGVFAELTSTAGYPIDPQFSPDGKLVACVRDGDLYVINVINGKESRITSRSGPTVTNGLAEFVAQEEMARFHGFWWSPDSSEICFEQADTAGMETFHIADPVNPDKEAESWPYPRPGKKNANVRLFVTPARTGGPFAEIPWDHDKYEYLASVSWRKDAPLLITLMSRDQTRLTVLAASRADDQLNAAILARGSGVFAEVDSQSDSAWINLTPGMPRTLGADRLLTMSERSGEWTLESRELKPAAQPTAVTSAGFGLMDVLGTGNRTDAAFVAASMDPTQSQVWVVPFNGGTPTCITSGPGHHGLTLSDESDVAVETASLMDGTSHWTVRHLQSGKPGFELATTREAPPWIPHLELTTVGPKAFHAAIIRPRDFDKSKKYPVIVNVYGGPHAKTVNATPQGYFLQQWIADQGFIVCSIDGRGTPGRGRDWERAIKNELIEPALEDQVEGLKALGAKFPEMDLSRAGIYGWSFGGYFSAMAAMKRPDIYKAGCAGAPVCDWLDYDTCYTERYLGVPALNKDGQPESAIYTKNSVLTYCKDLQVPLLIIHGTADDNVYFMHSLKMTQSLFRAGKEFEFLPLAGFTHMVPDPVVTTRLYSRIAMFFKHHLGEPSVR